MKKKRTFMIICLMLLVIILIGFITWTINPLHWSTDRMRNMLLKETPIGTDMDKLIQNIKSHEKWELEEISYERGYYNQEKIPYTRVGEQSIEVDMEDYGLILLTSTTIFYGFDKDSKLIDIWVWKTVDGI